jgi:prophage regulatory protein
VAETKRFKTIDDANRYLAVVRAAQDSRVALNVNAVAERYSVSVATVWRWVARETMPPPRKIDGCTRWLVVELLKWESGGCQPWTGSKLTAAPVGIAEDGTGG